MILLLKMIAPNGHKMFWSRRKLILLKSSIRLKSVRSTTKIVPKKDLPVTAYKPAVVESGKYEEWEKRALFHADAKDTRSTFSMVLPPPNVTGKLHLGHALASTVQDVIVRRQRALGNNVLWLPGTDHAGIATQGVVEKYLKTKDGIDRHALGREKFNQEVWKWKEKHGNAICEQLRVLGASLDWSRQIFTMDPKQTHAVNTAFIRLFKKGLIYRKQALVNWCVQLKSTISDIEVDSLHIEKPTDVILPGYSKPVQFGFMTDFAYKVVDSTEEVVVSTTMPETMLGDVAIAVHPADERYKHLHGARVHHPFREDTIPIIADEFVDIRLGTGAVKITPAHSKVDYEVGKRHDLQTIQVIKEDGCMDTASEFNGLPRYECRMVLTQKLNEIGLLKGTKPHSMTLPVCSRTGDVIEYLPKEQWFMSCSELNKKAGEVVRKGKLRLEPEKFVKNWLNWTDDDRDWCISRQLWWGHQIPAYKCCNVKTDDSVWVAAFDDKEAKSEAAKLLHCSLDEIAVERDNDVLDTWFSSGIYPFSSMGWPQMNEDYSKFYPLSLMATGHDILGFWVHRMVILGLELTGKLPFDKILLHGIISDNKGAKMSKSRGNVIDPIDVIKGITLKDMDKNSIEMHKSGRLSKEELQKSKAYHKSTFSNSNGIPECGVDALRFTLLSRDIKAHFVQFDIDLCHTNKLFGNKIWQSIKYLQMSFAKLKEVNEPILKSDLHPFDKWMLSRMAHMVDVVNRSMENYDFHIATKAIKTLLYSEFCDFYLEATKPGFDGEDVKKAYGHAHTLSAILNVSLRCLAPYMIYLSEELIPKIPGFEENIICNFHDSTNSYFDFPVYNDVAQWRDEDLEKDLNKFVDTVALVRQIKGFYGISNKLRPNVNIKTDDQNLTNLINENQIILKNLSRIGEVCFVNEFKNQHSVTGVLNKGTVISVDFLENAETQKLVELAKNKLKKKIDKAEETLSRIEARFLSRNYLDTTPEWTQDIDKEKALVKKEELKQLYRLALL